MPPLLWKEVVSRFVFVLEESGKDTGKRACFYKNLQFSHKESSFPVLQFISTYDIIILLVFLWFSLPFPVEESP